MIQWTPVIADALGGGRDLRESEIAVYERKINGFSLNI